MGSPEVRIIRLGGKATRSTAEGSLWEYSKTPTAHTAPGRFHSSLLGYPRKPNASAVGSDSKANRLEKYFLQYLLPVVFLKDHGL